MPQQLIRQVVRLKSTGFAFACMRHSRGDAVPEREFTEATTHDCRTVTQRLETFDLHQAEHREGVIVHPGVALSALGAMGANPK